MGKNVKIDLKKLDDNQIEILVEKAKNEKICKEAYEEWKTRENFSYKMAVFRANFDSIKNEAWGFYLAEKREKIKNEMPDETLEKPKTESSTPFKTRLASFFGKKSDESEKIEKDEFPNEKLLEIKLGRSLGYFCDYKQTPKINEEARNLYNYSIAMESESLSEKMEALLRIRDKKMIEEAWDEIKKHPSDRASIIISENEQEKLKKESCKSYLNSNNKGYGKTPYHIFYGISRIGIERDFNKYYFAAIWGKTLEMAMEGFEVCKELYFERKRLFEEKKEIEDYSFCWYKIITDSRFKKVRIKAWEFYRDNDKCPDHYLVKKRTKDKEIIMDIEKRFIDITPLLEK